jgi:hydrogenase expression/formation protein HypC
MCLAVPGKVLSIEESPTGLHMGTVDYGGITKEVCLACVPNAAVGDYVVVHAGFAISKLNEREADETLRVLAEMEGGSAAGDTR